MRAATVTTGARRRQQDPRREKLMVRRKILHLAVILSMVLTMVSVVLPTAVGAAGVAISPAAITFDPQQIGTQSPPTLVTISNADASANIKVGNITSGSGNFGVTGNGCTNATLQPVVGDSCTFSVVFKPNTISLGQLQTQITIQVSYDAGATFSNSFVNVSGTSTTPSFTIETPNSHDPMVLDFHEMQVRDNPTALQSVPQQVKFTNTGQGPILFVTKYFSGGAISPNPPAFADYNFTGDTCFLGIIGEGQSCDIWIAFAPQNVGNQDGEANFVVLANGFPFDIGVILKGTGVYPKGNVTPSQLNFDDQRIFTYSAPQVVTLTNTGTGPLIVPNNPDIDGANDNEFHIQNNHCQGGVVIPVGGNCTLEVNFRPTSVGVKTARLEFGNIPGPNSAVTLNGRGIAGFLSVDNGELDFGPQQQGTISAIKKIKVTNTSTESVQIFAPLIFDIIGNNNFTLLSDTCSPSSLGPNDSCELTVSFQPRDLGDDSAVLQIINSGNGGQGTPVQLGVLLTGVGTTVQGEIAPVQLNFAANSMDLYSVPQKVTFKNTGTGAIILPDDLLVYESDGVTPSPDFTIQSNQCEQGAVVPANGECSFYVVFKPSAIGARTGQIKSASLTNFLVSINGIGAAGAATVSPSALNFGDQQVDVQSNPQTLKLTNTSSFPVLVTTATTSDAAHFPISNNSCDTTVLLQNQWCSADFSFKPSVEGPASANASFASNAAGAPQTAPLLGNGVKAVATFQASAVDFGNQVLNTTSATQIITVTNKGPGNMLISSVTLTGANAGDFIIYFNDGCAGQLAPNATCSVQVKFKPTALGVRNAFLTFNTNAAGAPNNVSLTGNGTSVPTYTVALNVTGACTASAAPVGPYAGGDTVTLTINYNAAATIFTGWTVDGVYAGFSSPLSFGINNSSHNVLATCVAKPAFTDVSGATPYGDGITHLAALGVIKGYGNGNFGANDGIVRAQMAAITVRLAGWNNLVKPNIFTDRCMGQSCIDDELWNDVAIAAFFQVARGYEDNTFRPFDPVLNIQGVAFITRTMIKLGYWQAQPDDPTIYPNVSTGTGHRIDIVTYYHYAGAIPGTNPLNAWAQWDQNATRGYFAGIYWQAWASYFGVDNLP
jgi:hypothetical protein